MKNKLLGLVLFIAVALQSCSDDDVKKDDSIRKVKSFDKIDIDGDIIIKVQKAPSASKEIELKINSSSEYYSDITATSENGILTITGSDDITFAKNVIVEVAVPELSSIRLENTQHAAFYLLGDFHIPAIDIVTEAESKLEIYNLHADVISSRQEGESELILSSALDPLTGPLTFTGQITQINNTSILVDNKILVTGTSVEVNTTVTPTVYTVLGTVKKYYLTETASFITQGTTNIDASYLYVKSMDIKLEGESTASVWVRDLLQGKGEGSSVLKYGGSPDIQFTTSGSAKIIKQ